MAGKFERCWDLQPESTHLDERKRELSATKAVPYRLFPGALCFSRLILRHFSGGR